MTFQNTFMRVAAASALVAACFATAQAEPVLVDADAFPDGTDISSAFPGVTLSVEGHPGMAVVSRTGIFTAGPTAGENISPIGERVFGHELEAGTPPEDFLILWTDSENSTILRADFADPTDFVSIDARANDDDTFELQAFDAADNLLEFFNTGSFRDDVRTMSISRGTTDIAYFLAFGVAPEGGGLLDNLQFGVEPPACALQLSQASYTDGQIVTADVLRLSNPSAVPMTVELKIWFELPGQGPLQRVSVGDKSTITLGAGFDQDLGPLPLLPVTPNLSRGDYEASCRLLNPARGTELAADMNPFRVE